jgi:hypothetical protein
VRRLVAALPLGLGLLLLVSAPPACLLYTDRINRPPRVAIKVPEHLFPGVPTRFQAESSDPDGDDVSLFWMRVDGACPDDWKGVSPAGMGDEYTMVPGQTPFCLRLVARDSDGAESAAQFPGNPMNRPPEIAITLGDPAPAESYPLYTSFRVSASSKDPDGDTLTVSWQVRDGAGKDIEHAPCPAATADVCFTCDRPGTVAVTATAKDGGGAVGNASLTLNVAEDQPPCIEAADPAVDTMGVVLAVTDPPRRFEVRQVRDDGNPFPPGEHGRTTFRWYTATEKGPWAYEIAYDLPTFDVSAARFEDPRPGGVYRVRVEVRDAAHDSPPTMRDLEACADDRRVCEQPPHCVRRVWWKVQLQ